MFAKAMSLAAVSFLSLLLIAPIASVKAEITVHEPGFYVDVLVNGQLDGETPRIEAIRNPAYGNGAVGASISNGILTVRRFSFGSIDLLAVRNMSEFASVLDVRFDTSGLFGNKLFVSVFNAEYQGPGGVPTTEFVIVEPDGSTTVLGPIGSESNGLAMYVDFIAGAAGFGPGAYLFDLHGDAAGSSVWRLNPPPPDGDFEILAQNSLPPGRTDLDIRGLEFDRVGAFGGLLYLADADANGSKDGLIYTVNASLAWTPFNAVQSTDIRYYRDLALGGGGPLGNRLFVAESRSDVVEAFEPDGSSTVFASGFQFSAQYDHEPGGAASISLDEAGEALYIADDGGVYRIRPLGDEPGPIVLCHDPSTPPASPLTGAAVDAVRVIFNEPVTFDDADVSITNAGAQAVPFDASGSGSPFMIIGLGEPLASDTYTVTIADSVISLATGQPLDGDGNGVAGGDHVFELRHRDCCADCDDDGDTDLADFAVFQSLFTGPLP